MTWLRHRRYRHEFRMNITAGKVASVCLKCGEPSDTKKGCIKARNRGDIAPLREIEGKS